MYTSSMLNFQAHVEYETAKRHYAHVDCPGHADYVKVSLTFGLISPRKKLLFIISNCLMQADVWVVREN